MAKKTPGKYYRDIFSLALRYIGDFKKGIDYEGDRLAFRKYLQEHPVVAKQFGPYKLSLHNSSDKVSIYPGIADTPPVCFK
jgi:hypothetical protein